jgi:hypothetical protein
MYRYYDQQHWAYGRPRLYSSIALATYAKCIGGQMRPNRKALYMYGRLPLRAIAGNINANGNTLRHTHNIRT